MEKDIDELFSKGIELRDNGHLVQAAQVFSNIIKNYPDDSKRAGTFSVLAGIYFDLKDFSSSLTYFGNAIELKPQSELASLGLYLSYVELNNFDLAVNELKRYLEQYPAKLYKDTLKELLEDITKGYALKFKDIILPLAIKNGLSVQKIKTKVRKIK